jgi:hypothetical protein
MRSGSTSARPSILGLVFGRAQKVGDMPQKKLITQ